DWGEGKSHFLGLLQRQVKAIARPDNPLAHDAVRQVWFNAWHYAETDLWASLVAELFSQLAQPPDGDVGAEQRRQSRLMGELVAERGLRERLRAARARRDDLRDALRRAERDDLGSWAALTDDQKQQLRDLTGTDAEKFYREVVRTMASLRKTGRGSWRLLRGLRPASAAGVAVVLVVLVVAALAIAWGVPMVARWVATLPAATTLVTLLVLASRARAQTAKRAGAAWRAAVRFAAAQRKRLRTAAEVSAAEVAALEREVQNLTAAGQLAGLVAERAADTDYRSRLGVMTQIRQDFQHMATLLANAAHLAPHTSKDGAEVDTDPAGDSLPRIDRIILYIDDLDRCPPRRVVEMLEAIHLLLAVELFVVVVAVEPRWLLRAIATHYRDLLDSPNSAAAGEDAGSVDPDDEELWHSTPAQYLEKIFQVVLTLPPLDTGGYQRLLRTLVGTRHDQPTPAPEAPSAPTLGTDSATNEATTNEGRAQGGLHGAGGDNDVAQAEWYGVTLPAARVIERVDPLTLEPDELALLDLLGPPLLVNTPRAVKRLANSYGLLTAMRRDHRDADLAEQKATILDPATGTPREVTYRPYRAGVVLLGALVAFPSLGPALLLHLHHATHPQQTWAQFRTSLNPQQKQGYWCNPADPCMTPVQVQQWQALLHGLQHIEQKASEHGLPLPEPLSAWAPWVVPVGRLSFPAGRIVNTLDRQRPLTTHQDGTT
ncbi:MAG: P-loop NTPase fold protein, partial [Sciscionella sp.]